MPTTTKSVGDNLRRLEADHASVMYDLSNYKRDLEDALSAMERGDIPLSNRSCESAHIWAVFFGKDFARLRRQLARTRVSIGRLRGDEGGKRRAQVRCDALVEVIRSPNFGHLAEIEALAEELRNVWDRHLAEFERRENPETTYTDSWWRTPDRDRTNPTGGASDVPKEDAGR